jgi:GNAT superfamily N-acetyltransferase
LARVDIRIAREEELSSILALYNMTWKDSSSPLSRKVGENIFRKLHEHPDDELYVALSGDRVIGAFALLVSRGEAGASECVVENIVVHPRFRRQGAGRRIIDFATDKCRAFSCRRLTVTSRDSQDDLGAFLGAMGFEPVGHDFSKMIDQGK